MRMRLIALLFVLFVVVGALTGACTERDGGSVPRARSESPPRGGSPSPLSRPNLILILTDDQWAASLAQMPKVRALLGAHGVTFGNAFVTTSLCCPSRASILTGQYARHTGVFNNEPPKGGVSAFRDDSTLATWLKKAGYTTSYVGKYLNGYETMPGVYIPPGWDDWHVLTDPRRKAFGEGFYYDYSLNENGRLVQYRERPSDYSTSVLLRRSLEFIEKARSPFFLMLAPAAPHFAAIPAPEDEGRFAKLKPYRPPSFNEPDVSDKPWKVRYPRLRSEQVAAIDRYRRDGLESLQSVDRAVETIVELLESRRQLDRTVIVFTSDNGMLLGEHRMFHKVWAYEPSIRVPMLFRLPWAKNGRSDGRFVLNVDLAATLAELAGAVPGLPQDGRSLVPLLLGRSGPWRTEVIVEHLGRENGRFQPRRFTAIRTERWKLIEYVGGSRELYDLSRDPHELRNLSGLAAYRSVEEALARRLKQLN